MAMNAFQAIMYKNMEANLCKFRINLDQICSPLSDNKSSRGGWRRRRWRGRGTWRSCPPSRTPSGSSLWRTLSPAGGWSTACRCRAAPSSPSGSRRRCLVAPSQIIPESLVLWNGLWVVWIANLHCFWASKKFNVTTNCFCVYSFEWWQSDFLLCILLTEYRLFMQICLSTRQSKCLKSFRAWTSAFSLMLPAYCCLQYFHRCLFWWWTFYLAHWHHLSYLALSEKHGGLWHLSSSPTGWSWGWGRIQQGLRRHGWCRKPPRSQQQ